jgi:transcriptional regulator with XRE-family HTH domain
MDHLAANLRRLRAVRRWTQAELAERAGLPRATCAGLEQADTNPSLASVLAVAAALGVGLDELVRPDAGRRWFKVTPPEQEDYKADAGRFRARLISPIASKGVQIQTVTLAPGCRSVGRPHPEGAQEFFACLAGTATIQVAEDTVEVEAGCLLQFPGHLRHVYANRGALPVQAVSTVVLHLP